MSQDKGRGISPWAVSLLIHLMPALAFVGVFYLGSENSGLSKPKDVVSFEMIKAPPKPTKVAEIQTSAKKTPPPPKPQQKPLKRDIGAKRNSVTSDDKSAPTVKQGNTLLKEDEGKVLKEDDPTDLPVPEKEYLITQMPAVLKKTKIRYQSRDGDMGMEGSVIFNLLIDEKGRVRQAELVEGLIEEMNKEARRAVMGYIFSPAFVEGKAVAAKIRFSVRFILEES